MNRRDFLRKTAVVPAVVAVPVLATEQMPDMVAISGATDPIPLAPAPEVVDAAWIELMWREEPPQYGTVNSLADDEMRRIQLEAAERIVNTPIFLHLDGTRDYAGEELARKVDAEILAALK